MTAYWTKPDTWNAFSKKTTATRTLLNSTLTATLNPTRQLADRAETCCQLTRFTKHVRLFKNTYARSLHPTWKARGQPCSRAFSVCYQSQNKGRHCHGENFTNMILFPLQFRVNVSNTQIIDFFVFFLET